MLCPKPVRNTKQTFRHRLVQAGNKGPFATERHEWFECLKPKSSALSVAGHSSPLEKAASRNFHHLNFSSACNFWNFELDPSLWDEIFAPSFSLRDWHVTSTFPPFVTTQNIYKLFATWRLPNLPAQTVFHSEMCSWVSPHVRSFSFFSIKTPFALSWRKATNFYNPQKWDLSHPTNHCLIIISINITFPVTRMRHGASPNIATEKCKATPLVHKAAPFLFSTEEKCLQRPNEHPDRRVVSAFPYPPTVTADGYALCPMSDIERQLPGNYNFTDKKLLWKISYGFWGESSLQWPNKGEREYTRCLDRWPWIEAQGRFSWFRFSSVPVPERPKNFTARCLIIQVVAPKARWIMRCLSSVHFLLDNSWPLSRILSTVCTPVRYPLLSGSVRRVPLKQTGNRILHLTLKARGISSSEHSQFTLRMQQQGSKAYHSRNPKYWTCDKDYFTLHTIVVEEHGDHLRTLHVGGWPGLCYGEGNACRLVRAATEICPKSDWRHIVRGKTYQKKHLSNVGSKEREAERHYGRRQPKRPGRVFHWLPMKSLGTLNCIL